MMVKQINGLAGNYATQPSRMVSGGIRYAQIVPQAAVNIPKPSIIKIEKEFPFDSEIYAPSTGSYARIKNWIIRHLNWQAHIYFWRTIIRSLHISPRHLMNRWQMCKDNGLAIQHHMQASIFHFLEIPA